MSEGYISLHRSIRENAIYSKDAYFRVWVELLLLANHKDNDIILNGKKVTIKRGQTLTSQQKISKTLKISLTTVHRVFKYLKAEQMLKYRATPHYTMVTIINYGSYQNPKHKVKHKRNTGGTQPETNNNDNNVNKYIYKEKTKKQLKENKERLDKIKKDVFKK